MKYALPLSRQDWDDLRRQLAGRPQALLFDQTIRHQVVSSRARYFGAAPGKQAPSGDYDHGISFGDEIVERFYVSHFARLLYPLAAIDPHYENCHKADVLLIGARGENEILTLTALGFHPKRIKALGGASASPLIDPGDMHKLPCQDSSFDVVISNWILSYSNNQQQAVDEMLRAVRNNGLIAVGMMQASQEAAALHDLKGRNVSPGGYLTSDDLLHFFGDYVSEALYRHEPINTTQDGAMMMILRICKKSPNPIR